MANEITKLEKNITVPEGFSDLAIRVGNYRDSQKGYSPFVEGAVKTSNVLLQMGATIAQAFDNERLHDNFSMCLRRMPDGQLSSCSFSGHIDLYSSGNLRLKSYNPLYAVKIKPRKNKVIVSFNAGNPLSLNSVLYPLVYNPVNSMEPVKAFEKLEKILLKEAGTDRAKEINKFHEEFTSLPEVLHVWLQILEQRQIKQGQLNAGIIAKAELMDDSLNQHALEDPLEEKFRQLEGKR